MRNLRVFKICYGVINHSIYSNGYERFLNRHQLQPVYGIKDNFKSEMLKRCIPVKNRPVHTFVEATEEQLRAICGSQNNKADCMSKRSFTVYNIRRKPNNYYTNKAKVTIQAKIVVTCENNYPVHFVCLFISPEQTNW
uniref:Ribonuclease A-domain domain-containing protein n=1 Tax=Erpetoichthys calabaricus TaxID=27687 RepID=A0A8C4X3W7_ERPCA